MPESLIEFNQVLKALMYKLSSFVGGCFLYSLFKPDDVLIPMEHYYVFYFVPSTNQYVIALFSLKTSSFSNQEIFKSHLEARARYEFLYSKYFG